MKLKFYPAIIYCVGLLFKVFSKQINRTEDSITETLQLNKYSTPGIYQPEGTKPSVL